MGHCQVGLCGRTVNEVAVELRCEWHTVNDAVIAYGSARADVVGGLGEPLRSGWTRPCSFGTARGDTARPGPSTSNAATRSPGSPQSRNPPHASSTHTHRCLRHTKRAGRPNTGRSTSSTTRRSFIGPVPHTTNTAGGVSSRYARVATRHDDHQLRARSHQASPPATRTCAYCSSPQGALLILVGVGEPSRSQSPLFRVADPRHPPQIQSASFWKYYAGAPADAVSIVFHRLKLRPEQGRQGSPLEVPAETVMGSGAIGDS
jgi:hypothetical protein